MTLITKAQREKMLKNGDRSAADKPLLACADAARRAGEIPCMSEGRCDGLPQPLLFNL